MYVLLAFAVFAEQAAMAIPFRSLAECEAEKPKVIAFLKDNEAKLYAVTCVPLVKMEGV